MTLGLESEVKTVLPYIGTRIIGSTHGILLVAHREQMYREDL